MTKAAKRSGRSKSRQVAALPWRIDERRGLQVLMITSRETRRWVIPKGGRMVGKTDAEAASVEAVEEAGVVGSLYERPIGKFRYLKRLGPISGRMCVVSVYPLRVIVELGDLPERGQRDRQWMSREQAARAVHEPDLAALILGFRPNLESSALED